jgi:diguanylate cyclase (GGDEF)-like protein
MGGDEFLVVTTVAADVVHERIALFDQLVSRWNGRYVDSLTVSYGVASANEYPDLNFEELLKTADDIMYQNKKQRTEYR